MASIVDRVGNPLTVAELVEPQTAQLGWLASQIAGHPSRGLTPAKVARMVQSAETGGITAQHELFMDMEEKDGHIAAEMGKRKLALLTRPWSVAPPRNASAAEKSLAAEVEEWLQGMPDFEDVLLAGLDAIGHGFACLEIEWRRLGALWMPSAITHRPQTWFTVAAGQNSIRLRDASAPGAVLRPFGWITHIHKARSGMLVRCGLHRALAWPYLFRNYSARDMAEFLEIYGLPLRLGKYPSGATANEKATLLRAVAGIGHSAAGIIPQGMEIDFKEAAKGSHDPFAYMIEWCERTVSKLILGATLTSGADGKASTNALGKIHNEVRHDLMRSDARQLANTLTRDLIYPLLALNRGVTDTSRLPQLVIDTQESADLTAYADALGKLVESGMEIPQAWAHETLQIPRPANNEPVLRPAKPAAATPAAAARTRLAALSLRADSAEPPDTVDLQLEQLLKTATQDALIEPIAQLLQEVQSLDEFRQRLLEVFKTLPIDQFSQLMGEAMAAASRSEEHTSELQSHHDLVCRLLLEKK